MQDGSGCCGGGGDGTATGDGRGRDGLTLCLESACPVLGGASTVARRECGPRRPRSVTVYLCLGSARLRGAQRNCGQLWARAKMLFGPAPSFPSIPTARFCISCTGLLSTPSCVLLGVPHLQAALHNRAAYVILPGSSWYQGGREHSLMMVRFHVRGSETNSSVSY